MNSQKADSLSVSCFVFGVFYKILNYFGMLEH